MKKRKKYIYLFILIVVSILFLTGAYCKEIFQTEGVEPILYGRKLDDGTLWISIKIKKVFSNGFQGTVKVPDERGLFGKRDKIAARYGKTLYITYADGRQANYNLKTNDDWEHYLDIGSTVNVEFDAYYWDVDENSPVEINVLEVVEE